MIRRIIHIDEDKCNGCGACATACHEGAIGIVKGKAKLLRDDYCDGLGDCLPACPMDAIHFVEREAAAYDEAAVLANKAASEKSDLNKQGQPLPCGCPGTQSHSLKHDSVENACTNTDCHTQAPAVSMLSQWPVQIKLAPVNAPYFDGVKLLIAADCTAYAYASFHQDFIKGHITLVGCPKLDDIDYSEKLAAIIAGNDIKEILVARMVVPCCGGIEAAVKNAIAASGKSIPCQVKVISLEGKILLD